MKLSIKQQANRIRKVLDQATGSERKQGMMWYKDAHVFASDIAGAYELTVAQVAQLISLLSPQKKWEQNKADVVAFLDGDTDSIFSTKRTLEECGLVVDSNWTIPETRMKTHAFAKCIEEAYNNESDPVVIDRHAIKIAAGQMSAKPIIITDKRYRDASEAYRIIGQEEGLPAHVIQAITWVAYKRIVNR